MIINFLFTLLHIYSSHEVVVAYNCGSHTNVSTKYVKYLSVSLIMIEGRNVWRTDFANGPETINSALNRGRRRQETVGIGACNRLRRIFVLLQDKFAWPLPADIQVHRSKLFRHVRWSTSQKKSEYSISRSATKWYTKLTFLARRATGTSCTNGPLSTCVKTSSTWTKPTYNLHDLASTECLHLHQETVESDLWESQGHAKNWCADSGEGRRRLKYLML